MGLFGDLGRVGNLTGHGPAPLAAPPPSQWRGFPSAAAPVRSAGAPPTHTDASTGGGNYGATQVNAFKQSPSYRQAIIDTFLHQPKAQAQAIVRGALRIPSLEGHAVLNYLSSQGIHPQDMLKGSGLLSGVHRGSVGGNLGSLHSGTRGLSGPQGSLGASDILRGVGQALGGGGSPTGQLGFQQQMANAGGTALKAAGGAALKAVTPHQSDQQQLTARIGGATSPQDVLAAGGKAASGLIAQIPTPGLNTPGEKIAAVQGGIVPGGLGKHLFQNAVNLPAEVFPSMAIPAQQALAGHWGQALNTVTAPYVNAFKHPQQALYNDPLNTYLMFGGLLHPGAIAGETLGRAALGKGRVNLTPDSVHLTAQLTHERPNWNKSPITRASQKSVGMQFYGKNPLGQLVPRSDTVRARLIKLETSRLVGQGERVRRVGHAEGMVAHGNAFLQNKVGRAAHATKTALQYNPKPALIKGADVASLVAQGVIRRPDTWVTDLNKVTAMVAAHRPSLDHPADIAIHDKFVNTLKAARDNPPNAKGMARLFDASTAYAHDYAPIQAEAHALGHFRDMSADALQRRDVMTAFAVHHPSARMDPELGMVVDRAIPGAAAELARLRQKAGSVNNLGRRAGSAGEQAAAQRALSAVQRRIADSKTTESRKVSTAEMAAFVKQETGGRPVAFVSHEPKRGDKAHYVNQQTRPFTAKMGNSLYAFTHGLTNPSHEAMLEQRVRMKGIVDSHHAVNRLDQQLVSLPNKGKGWNNFADAQRDLKGSDMVPIRLAHQFHPAGSLQKALEADHVDMNTLQQEAAQRSLDVTARLSPSSEPGKFGAMNIHAANQLKQHEALISPNSFLRGLRGLTGQFRKVALATSFRHLPGVAQEVAIRSAMSGVGPISLFAGKAVFSRAKEINPALGRQRQIEHTGGMVTGQALSLQTRQVSQHFSGTLLHGPLKAYESAMRAPGTRQASTLWHAWMHFTLEGTKHVLEDKTLTASMGKQAIVAHGGLINLIGHGMRTWGKMVDQAAHGLLDENTARQMGATTRRIYGRWTDLTPGEQTALMFSPFGMWWTNSIAWLARMPIDHPMGAAFQAALNQGTQQERQKLGLDMFSPNHLPLYKQGGIPLPGGGLVGSNYYSPSGVANDPAATAASLIQPWLAPVVFGAMGKNWLANPITSPKNPKGRQPPPASDVAMVILNSLMSSFVPLYQKAQTLVQGGSSSYDTSTLLNPQTKGPNAGLAQGLLKDVMPLRLSKASQGATTPTGTGGGAGGAWKIVGGGAASTAPSGGGWKIVSK